LPSGWTLATTDSISQRVPGAAIAANHWRTGAQAGLIVNPATIAGSLEGYLGVVVGRLRQSLALTEIDRASASLGPLQARRVEVSWIENGANFRGFLTACKAGDRYYLLIGWSPEDVYDLAGVEFRLLESSIQFTDAELMDRPINKSESTQASRRKRTRK
jgi:hypothetical protein